MAYGIWHSALSIGVDEKGRQHLHIDGRFIRKCSIYITDIGLPCPRKVLSTTKVVLFGCIYRARHTPWQSCHLYLVESVKCSSP